MNLAIYCFALLCFLSCKIEAKDYVEAVSTEKSSLVGFTIKDETVLDVTKLSLPDLSLSVLIPNATEVNTKGPTARFTTAVCHSTKIFVIGINDILSPRLVVVNLLTRKVVGIIKVTGILVDNVECDDHGYGFAYVFQLGLKHLLIQIDFAHLTYTHLMHSSYRSYGGSTIDNMNKRFFTIADLPYYESFNYSLSVLEYGKQKEWLTAPFKDHSIGSVIYDPQIKKMFAFVQTPAGVMEKKIYKTYLAELNIEKGTVIYYSGPWPRVAFVEESGLTLDRANNVVYVITNDNIRAVDLKSKKVTLDRTTADIPRPRKSYEFVTGI